MTTTETHHILTKEQIEKKQSTEILICIYIYRLNLCTLSVYSILFDVIINNVDKGIKTTHHFCAKITLERLQSFQRRG